jgi:transposase
MRAYSMDLRTRVLAALDAGDATAVVADRFAVSSAWVRRLAQRRRQTGEVTPRTRTPNPLKLRDHVPRLRELLTATPDRTLAELRADLGVTVALSTLWVAVRRLGYTLKKR